MKRFFRSALVAVLLAIPVVASAEQGYTTGNVNMRAGPDEGYPAIDLLGAGTAIDIQGCTTGWEWCDVIGNGNRGWVAGNYIQYMYNSQPVLLPSYGAQIGVPIVAFSIGTYWSRYYSNRPFYRERSRWYARPMPHRPPPPPLHRPGPMPGGNRPGPQPGPGNRPPPRPQPGGNRPPPRPQPGNGNRPPPRPQPGGNRPAPQPGNGRPPQGGNRPPPNPGNRPGQPGGNRPAPKPAQGGNKPPPDRPKPQQQSNGN